MNERSTRYNVVTPEWVAEHHKDADVRILDTRSDVMLYFPGHVPNAVHLADFSLRAPIEGFPVQYLPLESLAALFARAGVDDSSHVVVYADGEMTIGASMTLYALELLGHERASYLDGGFSAFRKTHQPSQAYPEFSSATVTVYDKREIGIHLPEVAQHLEHEGAVIIDARPANFYLGQPPKTWMRDGHIPGAINIDWHGLMQDDIATLRPVDDLERIYADAGVERSQDIVVTCGTSREASMEYFVLKHVLGFPRVRLYEGSWTEWSAHPELPMETKPVTLR